MAPILILLPIYILLIVLSSSISFVFIVFFIYLIYRKKKMKIKVYELLENIAKENKNLNYKLSYVRKKPYDIYYETLTHIYYIKLLPNHNNAELYLENRDNAYLVTKINPDQYKKLNLKAFTSFKLKENPKKEVEKLLLIYPNAKAIISYINQCELNFIYDDETIYGMRIITYENLSNRHNIIEGR